MGILIQIKNAFYSIRRLLGCLVLQRCNKPVNYCSNALSPQLLLKICDSRFGLMHIHTRLPKKKRIFLHPLGNYRQTFNFAKT